MSFWTDLIWIGNTLYPRWFVFGGAGLLALVAVIVAFVVLTSVGRSGT